MHMLQDVATRAEGCQTWLHMLQGVAARAVGYHTWLHMLQGVAEGQGFQFMTLYVCTRCCCCKGWGLQHLAVHVTRFHAKGFKRAYIETYANFRDRNGWNPWSPYGIHMEWYQKRQHRKCDICHMMCDICHRICDICHVMCHICHICHRKVSQ